MRWKRSRLPDRQDGHPITSHSPRNHFISYIVYKFSDVKNRGIPQRSACVTPIFGLSRTRIVDRNNSRSRWSRLPCFANTYGKGARLPADQPRRGENMCGLDDMEEFSKQPSNVSRRQFGALALGTGLAMALPRLADAAETKGVDVEIKTPDGTCDAYFVSPAKGRHPAVLTWPDILGLRPA